MCGDVPRAAPAEGAQNAVKHKPMRNIAAASASRKLLTPLTLLALLAVLAGLWGLSGEFADVAVGPTLIGSIPAIVFRPQVTTDASSRARPVIVIAHGFAGSQQLMQPIALTLARNGYIAVTFDFAGHGRNTKPMPGGVADLARSTQALLAEIGEVAAFARALPGADGRLALVGHSMASDLVVDYAMTDASVSATAALSLFGRDVTANSPRNLIVIDGAWEPAMLTGAGYRIVGMAAAGAAIQRVTYGDFAAGTARRLVLAEGAEHIGVLYSRDALRETLAWMDSAFGTQEGAPRPGSIDRRGKWLALLFAGLVAFARPASRALPVLSVPPLGAGLGWKRLLPIAIAPAILTPLILWKAPTDFLPILLGDYLVVHLALYGVLTGVGLLVVRGVPLRVATRWTPFALSALALAAYYIVALGAPIDAYVTSFTPTGVRWALIAAMFAGAAPYFLADEWLTRGAGAARGAYPFTKLCFLVSLGIAVALNPQKLFFLAIIAPVMLVLFVVYGLVSRWVAARTGDPRVSALGAAAGLAWAIAVTFPIVG